MDDAIVLKKLILKKLIRGSVWGGKHTPLDFVKNGIPDHYRHTHKGQKMLENVLKDLMNDGWIILLQKKTGKGSGIHISLNPRKVQDINQFLEEQQQFFSV